MIMKHKDFTKIKAIKVPIYPFHIIFCIITDEARNKYMPGDGYTTLKEDSYDVIVYLDKKASEATVSHEIYHAGEIIMHKIGHIHPEPPNEPLAYLIGWITEQYYIFNKKK